MLHVTQLGKHRKLKSDWYDSGCELGSSVSIVTGYGLGDQGLIHDGEAFSFTLCAQPTLGPSQLLVQWVLGVHLPRVKCSCSMMLTTHPIVVLRLKNGALSPLPLSTFHGM
jgi:hypothetical protein